MKILITDDLHPTALKMLEQHEITLAKPEGTKNTDFEAIIIRTHTRIGEKEIQKFGNLKHVITCSVGIDNINTQALEEKGIKLVHVPGTNANSVGEHALLLALQCHRKGEYEELEGKTVGFIGFGAVGKSFAKKLAGFNAKKLVYDVIKIDDEIMKELGSEQTRLDKVLKKSDVITIHVPLLASTKGMVNEECFNKMKKGVYIINTSRAEVINEKDFEKAVENGTIKKAGLDVYSEELREKYGKDERFVFTKHVGAKGNKSFENMCVQPVKKFLKLVENNSGKQEQ